MLDGEREAHYEDGFVLVDRLLSGETVEHHGRYFEISGIGVTPRPVRRPRPPIWSAGSAVPAVRRAARVADGWMTKPGEAKSDLRRLVALYRAELADTGERADRAGPIVRRDGWIAPSTKLAWDEALPALHFHYTRDYSFIPDHTTLDDVRVYGHDRFLIGDAEHLVHEMRWYRDDLGASGMVLALDRPGLPPEAVLEAIRMVGETVLPELRRN